MTNKLSQFARTGTVLSTKIVEDSRVLADYATEKLKELAPGVHVDFDCIHNDGGTYSVHEFCGALGGISVRYMSYYLHLHILRESIDSNPTRFINYAEKLKETSCLDKYMLRTHPSTYEKVIFLSGSNVMHDNIDFELVKAAVEDGAVIKPHPVTHAKDAIWLAETFGAENVLGSKVSGGELLKGADIVYCAKNSEMYLLGIAFEKTMRWIGRPEFMAEVYRPAIDACINHPMFFPKIALNRLLSHDMSGIYFTKEEVDRGLAFYVRRVNELRVEMEV